MADVMEFSTTHFFVRPEHEQALRTFVDALQEGIDGDLDFESAGVSLDGSNADGFTLLCWGLMDGAPRIRVEALQALLDADEGFRDAWEDLGKYLGDEPVEIGEVLQALLEPDTHFILRCHSGDGAYEHYSVELFHADGDSSMETLPRIEERLRKARGVKEVDAKAVKAARAARGDGPVVPKAKAKAKPKRSSPPGGAASAAALPRESHTVNSETFEMVHCPPGTFTMGSPKDEAGRRGDETQHKVTLTRGFALGVFPVTQALWKAVTGKHPSYFQDGDDAPAENVSWFDAVRLCNALSAKVGLAAAYTIGEGDEPLVTCDFGATGFRLPTEAEWEYAARSGGDAFVYAGSDNVGEVGWYQHNSDRTTHGVGQKQATRWGMHDLTGNVWEWCWDVFGDYVKGEVTDPTGAPTGPRRVSRGGSWVSTAGNARAANRGGRFPGVRVNSLGLRLSRTIR